MGWIDITNDVKYYSIADEIGLIVNKIFDFLGAVSPGVWVAIITLTLGIMVISLFISFRYAIKRLGDAS